MKAILVIALLINIVSLIFRFHAGETDWFSLGAIVFIILALLFTKE